MWIADNWKDYEIIDCSKGEKLERWGKYLLVRPDPQVIWDTPKTDRGWKNMNGHYHAAKRQVVNGNFLSFLSSGRSITVRLLLISSRSVLSIPVFFLNRQPTGTGFQKRSATPADLSKY